jgi:hypothetical protein
MINFIALITFLAYNVLQAKHDAVRIQKNLRIYHGINGLAYVILIVLWWTMSKEFGLPQAIAVCIIRIPVFNTSLNYFRGLPLHYISSKTTSIVDKLTYSIVKKLGYYTYNLILLLISAPIYLI